MNDAEKQPQNPLKDLLAFLKENPIIPVKKLNLKICLL